MTLITMFSDDTVDEGNHQLKTVEKTPVFFKVSPCFNHPSGDFATIHCMLNDQRVFPMHTPILVGEFPLKSP